MTIKKRIIRASIVYIVKWTMEKSYGKNKHKFWNFYFVLLKNSTLFQTLLIIIRAFLVFEPLNLLQPILTFSHKKHDGAWNKYNVNK